MYLFNEKEYKCSLEASMDVLGGKWRSLIIWHLLDKKLRFSELQKVVPGISRKVLSEHLRILEKNELIIRTVHPSIPPKVEYEATETGKSLAHILDQLENWGRKTLYENDNPPEVCPSKLKS